MPIRMLPSDHKTVDASIIHHRSRSRDPQQGLTFIELLLVVLIIVVFSFMGTRGLGNLSGWKQEGELRAFINTWQFLYSQAVNRGEGYRLLLDLDNRSYSVLREFKVRSPTIRQVDHLEGLRIESERQRRKERNAERRENLEQLAQEEDSYQSGNLEALFYDFLFTDLSGETQLSPPLEFPSLAEPVVFGENIIIRDVKLADRTVESGEVAIRFSPRGASDFAVVHLQVNQEIFTAFMNPSSGELVLERGDLDYNWIFRTHG